MKNAAIDLSFTMMLTRGSLELKLCIECYGVGW